jgi:hypothetical protein
VAALVTTAGTLVGHVLKEVVLARSFEAWKSRRALNALYRKYRDPIVLSAIELANRLSEICRDYPTDFLASTILGSSPPPPTHGAERDTYFRRYKLQSTIYRLAAFLAWLELFRQDIVFLDTGTSKTNSQVQDVIGRLRAALADGFLNTAEDWEAWADALIFREEQRALGEALIVQQSETRVVMGYGAFVTLFDSPQETAVRRWFACATNFFVDPSPNKDFRLTRYRHLLVILVELVRLLEPKRSLQGRLLEDYGGARKALAIALLAQFLSATRSAEAAGCAPALLHDALQLGSSLSGKPGEGALEVYGDLDQDLAQTRAFIARWRDEASPESKQLIAVAQRIREALSEMIALVQSTPPEVMRAIRAGFSPGPASDGI